MAQKSVRLPPLNALRAFDASARRLSFTAAADELGLTQGAVAQHVRGLEANLGIKLFERLPRALALTEPGRRYAAQLRRAFEIVAEATAELRPEPLRLTISVTPTFAAKWLVPRLSVFNEAHPDIELRILASDVLSNFQSDGVNLAVRQGRPPFGPGLVADLLFEQELVAVCNPTLLGNKTVLATSDLRRVTLLNDSHNLWPEFCETALGLRWRPPGRQASFNHTALAIDAAAAGQGVALVSRFLVEQDLSTGRLALAFAAKMRGNADYYVVRPRIPRQPDACGIICRWLFDCASEATRR
jgi:LysR family glycine cleavage system transcriptional activator